MFSDDTNITAVGKSINETQILFDIWTRPWCPKVNLRGQGKLSLKKKLLTEVWFFSRFTKMADSIITLMAKTRKRRVGCVLSSVLDIRKNKTWQYSSTVAIYIIGHTNTFPRDGNSWSGTTKNTQNSSIFLHYWRIYQEKVCEVDRLFIIISLRWKQCCKARQWIYFVLGNKVLFM